LFLVISEVFCKSIVWEDCGLPTKKMLFTSFDVNPTPIYLKNDMPFIITTGLELEDTLQENIFVTVRITKYYQEENLKGVIHLRQ